MLQCKECGNTFLNPASYSAHRTRDRKLHIVPLPILRRPSQKRWVMEFEGTGGAGQVTVSRSRGACRLGDLFEAYGGMLGLKRLV